MGWVSMREDQIAATSERLRNLRTEVEEMPAGGRKRSLVRMLEEVDQLVDEGRSLLQLVSGPDSELATQIVDLRERVVQLTGELVEVKAERDRLKRRLEGAELAHAKMSAQLERARDYFGRIAGSRKLEAYDRFMAQGRPRRRRGHS